MKDFTGVYELDSSDNITITEALGINAQRLEQLKKMLPKLVEGNDRVSQTLEAIWNEVNHPNEFAWMVFIYGANTGLDQSRKLDIFKDLLDKFKRDMENDD